MNGCLTYLTYSFLFFLCWIPSAFLHLCQQFPRHFLKSNPSVSSLYRSFLVWHYRWRGPQRGFDRAQPSGRPETLPYERCGTARISGSTGHAGRCSFLQLGCGHCSGNGHPLPRHVHQHRLVKLKHRSGCEQILTHVCSCFPIRIRHHLEGTGHAQ